MIQIKKVSPTAVLPKYQRPGDAGLDLHADVDMIINPRERKLIPTGISMAIPQGYVGLIWDRSGLAAKSGLKTGGGVIDSNYRGEIGVVIHNFSQESFKVEKGMRIAQMLIQPVEQREIVEVEELESSSRGENGFGSTGLK